MSIWCIYLIISATFLVTSIAGAVYLRKRRREGHVLTPLNVLLAGVFISSFVLFLPINGLSFEGKAWYAIFKQISWSLYQSLSLFFVASPLSEVAGALKNVDASMKISYEIYAGILYTFAPCLTISVILLGFSDFYEYTRYLLSYWKNVFVFSELNEKSVALATNIVTAKDGSQRKKHWRKGTIVFAAGSNKKYDNYSELIEKARDIRAIVFEKGIQELNLGLHAKHRKITFFVINEDDADAMRDAIWLVEKYRLRDCTEIIKRRNKVGSKEQKPKPDRMTELYVFSDKPEAEMVFNYLYPGVMKVRRINESQALIYRTIYDKSIFALPSKRPPQTNGNKLISVIIVGLGKYGAEMLKAVIWCGQMDGFDIEVNVFEQDPSIVSRFKASCPELVDEEHNGKETPDGDARYSIFFHTGIVAGTEEFMALISKIPQATLVFVALGSDTANIEIAASLRVLFERMGVKPEIQATIYNSEKKEKLAQAKNFRGQEYDIDCIGDLKSLFSEEVILDSNLEKKALELHKRYGKESDFYQYEYNYRSSIALAIHGKYKRECGIRGMDKKNRRDLNMQEEEIIGKLEQRRWNAYMRTEGYIYSGSLDKESRNYLGKKHHNLVPFGMLSEEDKKKAIDFAWID